MAEQTYQAQYYQENREELLAGHRAWYRKNSKKVIEQAKKRLKKLTKAQRRVIAQRYYKRNRQEILKRARTYYLENRAHIKAKVKEYAQTVRRRQRVEGAVRGKRIGQGVRAA